VDMKSSKKAEEATKIHQKKFGNKDDKVLSKFEFEGQTSEKPV